MLFNSLTFVLFFLIVFSSYWLLRSIRLQNTFLLVASYVFYGAWSWKFLVLILASTLIDYYCGWRIGMAATPRQKRGFLILSLVSNLGILCFFKYTNFFVNEAIELLNFLGLQAHPLTLQIILPIGISFYTFQSLSYTIDIYRNKLEPIRNLADFALYVAFFPQLVAGPIERATTLLPQILQPRTYNLTAVGQGVQLMIWGMFKKVVIADNLAPYVDHVYHTPEAYTGTVVLSAMVFFAFQMYCDFSGYTDIARGAAQTLGFTLSLNFNRPYFATTPVDYWQRWHISLSKWFQDYLYFPLAMHYMRRGGWLNKYKAHIYAMALIGFWHGANWTYVVFGLYWGVAIVLYLIAKERLNDWRGTNATPPSAGLARVKSAASMAVMFGIICVGLLVFRAESLPHFWFLLTHVVSSQGSTTVTQLNVWSAGTLWTMVASFWLVEWSYFNFEDRTLALLRSDWLRLVSRYAMLVAILLCYIIAQERGPQPFIYFQF